MKTRYKIALLVVALFSVAFFVFQMPHNRSATVTSALAQDGDQLPMTADGFVDYLELTNRRLREKVTVDNNVVVDIVQIFGTEECLQDEIKLDFLALLGNPEINHEGRYRDIQKWARELSAKNDLESFSETVNDCYSNPWTAADHPLIAKWLEEHNAHLDQIVSGSRKPYYYQPLCEPNKIVIGALLPYAQLSRELGRGLILRAMNELANGDLKACLRDLAAIRRLGKLMDQGNTLVENLVGYAITGIAFGAEQQVLNSLANGAQLPNDDIANYRKVIRETSTRELLADTMRMGEAVFIRDCVQRMERGQTDCLQMIGGQDDDWTVRTSSLLSPLTDWEVVFEKCEMQSEQIAAAMEIENDLERHQKLREFQAELDDAETRIRTDIVSTLFRVVASAHSRGNLTGELIVGKLAPAAIQVDDARLRTVGYEISDLGFAMELYRRQYGQFPEKLEKLIPEFVATIPYDRFLGTRIQFQRVENGYRIWNVGRNRIDEQKDHNGRLVDWRKSTVAVEGCDDTYIDVRIKK